MIGPAENRIAFVEQDPKAEPTSYRRDTARTATRLSGSEWPFPGYRAGQHIHPNTLMDRLREAGIDLLVARNASCQWPIVCAHVNVVPAPLVAEMLGYSYQVTQKHAAAAAGPGAKYPMGTQIGN